MDELFKDKAVEKMELSYFKEDSEKLFSFYIFFDRNIEKGNKIPARVLKKFFALFNNVSIEREKLKERFIKNHSKGIVEKLKEYKHGFNISFTKNKKTSEEFTDILLSHVANDINITKDRDRLIELCYNTLRSYLRDVPKKKEISFYSHTVIVGIILVEFNLLLIKDHYESAPKRGQYYTQYLHNSTKYICDRLSSKPLPPIVFKLL